MKRSLGTTSDSPLAGLMSICHTSSADEEKKDIYSREFETMLESGMVDDQEGCVEESAGHVGGKKRRLSVEQVKALEINFEVENKLEPERKVKLAQELSLQPRQVAVWFQNRRARWKTKQLERDYGILKANFDALKHNFDNLQHDNQALHKQMYELKSKLEDDKGDIKVSVKEEEALMVPPPPPPMRMPVVVCSNNNGKIVMSNQQLADKAKSPPLDDDDDDDDMLISEFDDDEVVRRDQLNFEIFNSNKNGLIIGASSIFKDVFASSDDSESSAILNEENNNNNNSPDGRRRGRGRGEGILENVGFGFQFSDTRKGVFGDGHNNNNLSQFVKIEEPNLFSGDHDSCTSFFTDDQPPTLHWDSPHPWN